MKTNYKNPEKIILVAEDDPDDRMMIRDAFLENEHPPKLFFVEDGEELIYYLKREKKFSDIQKYPLPNLILLDLNMPRKDGREALREIKKTIGLKQIPVIILSTSTELDDISRSYEEGSNCFLIKPFSFQSLVEMTKSFNKYWIETAELPEPKLK